jgi:hypothetical protein
MDTSQKPTQATQNQGVVPPAPSVPATQPSVPQAGNSTPAQTPASVPSPAGKEYEPGQSLSEYASLPGAELEPVVAPELKEAGVEAISNPEHPKLTIQDKRNGITPGADSLTHPTTAHGVHPIPMTKEKATEILENKEFKIWDSIKWYAKNMFRQHEKEEGMQ